jgi:hypothetical protein
MIGVELFIFIVVHIINKNKIELCIMQIRNQCWLPSLAATSWGKEGAFTEMF